MKQEVPVWQWILDLLKVPGHCRERHFLSEE
jgi:hypothetical protein